MFEVISVNFYENIKKLMNESRKHVVNYVNTTMLFTYWNIGKMIVEEQGGSSKAKYGNKIDIYCGVEEDAFSYVNRKNFDYIMGSSHYFNINNH